MKKTVVYLLLGAVAFFILVPFQEFTPMETAETLIRDNLNTIGLAVNRTMSVSNLAAMTQIRKPMVDCFVETLDIAELKWPDGSELVTTKGLVPVNKHTSESQWNDFLTNDCLNGYLAVVYDGKTITTDRSSED